LALSLTLINHTILKEGMKYTIMIRESSIFSKLNFSKLSEMQLFSQAMQDFSIKTLPCPYCGAKHPAWHFHASYERFLITFEKGIPVNFLITITRIICFSCKHTHAILPEILIPFSSYSLLFVLRILRDYYAGYLTVVQLCDKYQVSVSTLYAWKRLFLLHKKLWLGILEDLNVSVTGFLSLILSNNPSYNLNLFFCSQGFSFLQGVSKTTLSGYG
jgi:hypothetical protein